MSTNPATSEVRRNFPSLTTLWVSMVLVFNADRTDGAERVAAAGIAGVILVRRHLQNNRLLSNVKSMNWEKERDICFLSGTTRTNRKEDWKEKLIRSKGPI